jgi:hypothetical protein
MCLPGGGDRTIDGGKADTEINPAARGFKRGLAEISGRVVERRRPERFSWCNPAGPPHQPKLARFEQVFFVRGRPHNAARHYGTGSAGGQGLPGPGKTDPVPRSDGAD